MSLSPRSKRLLVPAAAVAVLAVALVCGLATALAASSSPSPASGKVVLKIGWTAEPDNLNPFIGWANTTYEIWSINYDFLFGFGLNGGQPTLDLAARVPHRAERRPLGRRQGLDHPPEARPEVVRRPAAHRRRRRLHLQLRGQEPDGEHGAGDRRHHGAKALDPTTVRITCSQPKADMEYLFLPILPKHVWEHVSPRGGGDDLRQQAADRGQRPVLHDGLQEGLLHRDGAQPLLLGQATDRRRDLLRDVPERQHDGLRSEVGEPRRRLGHPRGAVQAARVAGRHPHHRLQLLQLGLPQPQLLHTAQLARQPGAAGLRVPQRSELRRSTATSSAGSPTTASPRRRTTILPPDTWVEPRLSLAATGRPGLHRSTSPRPTSSWTRPATRAAPSGLRLVPRASRSACACGRRPTSAGADSRPSSSPAGSRSSA